MDPELDYFLYKDPTGAWAIYFENYMYADGYLYLLDLTLEEPIICGDTFVDSGEECDDGNLKDGDGCSNSCRKEVAKPYWAIGVVLGVSFFIWGCLLIPI